MFDQGKVSRVRKIFRVSRLIPWTKMKVLLKSVTSSLTHRPLTGNLMTTLSECKMITKMGKRIMQTI